MLDDDDRLELIWEHKMRRKLELNNYQHPHPLDPDNIQNSYWYNTEDEEHEPDRT